MILEKDGERHVLKDFGDRPGRVQGIVSNPDEPSMNGLPTFNMRFRPCPG